jgi:ligand-binding sensor protein
MIQCFRAQSVTDLLDEEVLRLLLTGASVEYGIPLALFESNGSEIARFDPTVKDSQSSAFCKEFRLDPAAEQACLSCDRDHARAAFASANDVQTHTCRLGLTHLSVPLSVYGAKLGVLLSGQIRQNADDGRFVDRPTRWTSHLGATRVRELGKIHAGVPDTSPSELSEVQERLRCCAGFLQTSLTRAWRRYREEREKEFLVELTRALSASLAAPRALDASVEVLCGTLRDFLGTSDLAVVLYDRRGGRRLAFAAMGLDGASPPPAFVPPGSLENAADRFVLHANDSDIVRWLAHSETPAVGAAVHRFSHLDHVYALIFGSADLAQRVHETRTLVGETLWSDVANAWGVAISDGEAE